MSTTSHSRPPSERPERPEPAGRRLRGLITVLALVAIASISILVQAQTPGARGARPPAATPATAPVPAASAAPSASGAPATPSDPGAGAATKSTERAGVITEEISGFGAKTIEVPQFDCQPVRKDEAAQDEQFPVPMPPFSAEIFPCTRCHDRPTDYNLTARNLTVEHTNIKLAHGPREQWCYGCHNPTNRDKLRLAGGTLVSFEKSYELCGQCHGPKFRDWRLGIHGRRTGCWNGKREYRLCVHCHNPHAPKFQPLKPKPRPPRPSEIH